MGENIEIQIAIAVIVGKSCDHGAISNIQSVFRRFLNETQGAAGAFPVNNGLIDKKLIRIIVIADVDVEIPIIINISQGNPDCPGTIPSGNTRFPGDIGELHFAGLQKQTVLSRAAAGKDVGAAIQIQIAHSDGRAG